MAKPTASDAVKIDATVAMKAIIFLPDSFIDQAIEK
jgi:hypothetical protein